MDKMRNAKTLFTKLSSAEKLVMIGSGLAVLSVFLPWYRDLDAWGKGDTFLGLTGPLSAIGLVILLGSGAVFAKMLGRMIGKKLRLLEKFDQLATYVAAENVLLFVITSSIYFDPKFGVNITLKQTAFGLFLCLIGSAVMAFGSYMRRKEPAKVELNIFEQVEESIDRIHKDIARENPNFRQENDVPLAERQYRESHETGKKNETLRMDI
ncbi:MAG: hypothetical protein Q8P68_03060 [Candidatus Peregrinibacteria bacterium]|nr:hypothetical protein [Candidatus Peregrinibacteria bacterium]MDZ4244713.1 hypothetical protein [Candidatus Gracilibacteria bacterium]